MKEWKSMQELQSRNNIVTDADKCGAVGILDVKDYVIEAETKETAETA